MPATPYTFDAAHSSVNFHARHMVVSKVHGQFKKWTGTLLIDEADYTRSSVEVHIDASSVDTQVGQRDDHLRSPDFLDVQTHPEIVFIERVSDEHYRIVGDLTIRGVTKEVTLETEFNGRQKSPWGDERAGFSASTTIDRSQWALTYNKVLETGGLLVSDKIGIAIEVEAIRQAATAAA
jgi:polyisoprenoid-binding protein YceI